MEQKHTIPTISLCMIVKDEEETLARCLDSIRDLIDEIVIVDTGSSDRTKEIAKQYTDRIYDFTWINDFSAARNFSFEKATMDYILWLDADDVLTKENQEKFMKFRQLLTKDTDVVAMRYHTLFDASGNVAESTVRTRLVKRTNHYKWVGKVHEGLQIDKDARAIAVDIAITHKKGKEATNRNWMIYEHMLQNGETLRPIDLFHYGKECLAQNRIKEALDLFEKYLNTPTDEPALKIDTCTHMADCYFSMNDQKKALHYCLKSFEYGPPYPEATSRLGNLFIRLKDYDAAIFWSRLSLQLPIPTVRAITSQASYTWYPHINLCSCYIQLNDYKKAYKHFQKAFEYAPKEPMVVQYREAFDELFRLNPELEEELLLNKEILSDTEE